MSDPYERHCNQYVRCTYRDPDRPGECRCSCEKCYGESTYAAGITDGAIAERARIVLYLREMGSDDEANEIERGAHLSAALAGSAGE